MSKVIKVLIILFMVTASPAVSYVYSQDKNSQKNISPRKTNTRALKEKRRKEKEIQKAEEDSRKQHLNLQDKKTRKRMKRNRKATQAQHDNKKELFFVKWFRKGR
jgi:hypothetical protein